MSRIGKKPVKIVEGINFDFKDNVVKVSNKNNEMTLKVHNSINIEKKDDSLFLSICDENESNAKAYLGLYRMLIQNMITGLNEGFVKKLEIIGVGYKAAVVDNYIDFDLGFSHKIFFEIPDDIKVEVENVKGKNIILIVKGIDKQKVGFVPSEIRKLRKVEPYKGKGIRYLGEQVTLKVGKKTGGK
jgi:large subunit ribosomal protein L6